MEHEKYISRVVRQVIKRSRIDMDFSGNKGLKLTGGGACPKNHVIPDATFGAMELDLFGSADSWMPCDGVAMVLEVTSTKPEADREAKRRCYAREGIPLHLLVDRETAMVTLFSEPEKDDYLRLLKRSFGDPLLPPAPFAFELETTDLPLTWRDGAVGPPGIMVGTADEPGGRPRGVPRGLPEERPGSTGQGGG